MADSAIDVLVIHWQNVFLKELSKTKLTTMKNLQNYEIESRKLYQQLEILTAGIKVIIFIVIKLIDE